MPIKRLLILAGVSLLSLLSAHADEAPRAPSLAELTPTQAERNARLGWWREARFGMFIHWGVSADLGGAWNGRIYGGYAEHIQRMARIPIPVYHREVAGKFNPTKFDPDEWVRMAKEAGMGYFIITAKHHDGFAMYDSKVSDATIVKATPFARDPMMALREACRKYGLKFGFYYSHAFDWGEENGPGNDWDFDNPGGDKTRDQRDWWNTRTDFLPKARRYVDEKSIPQILELIHHYDPDILWFDTPHKLPPEENLRILAAVRQAKPSLVVNGRLVRGAGDYLSTADRPAEFSPQAGDWESIPTTNESYGYNAHDLSHKPAAHFIRLLAKAAARGGNTLLNIGPMGNGRFDEIDVAILREIGAWWRVNGEAIRGTERTPLPVQAWGESTRRGNRLYLHVFDWPADGQLVIGGLTTEVVRSYLLAAPEQPLAISRSGLDVTLTVPQPAPHAASSVIVLECAAEPRAEGPRLLSGRVAADTLHVFDGRLEGKLRFGPGKKTDDVAFNWLTPEDAVVWSLRLNEPLTVVMTINYDAPRGVRQTTVVEGDAGQEIVKVSAGAGGTYRLSLGGREFTRPVTQGAAIQETLGTITLAPGRHELRVTAQAITGEELFRLRKLTLQPPKP